MSAPPYMRLYWGDYFRDTGHLSRGEHGAYLLLLAALWNRGGKLPDDDAVLAKFALCTPREWASIKATIMAFFQVRRGQVTHKRITAELTKYESTIGKRKAAGRKGGLASRGQDEGNSEANANHKPTKPEPEPKREGIDPSLSGERAQSKGSRRKRETPLPAGFPDADLIDEAEQAVRSAGVRLDIADQAARFRAHALTNDRRVRDWAEAFRGWVGIEIRRAPSAPPAETAPAWMGPPDIQALVDEAFGDQARARSFLSGFRWRDVPERAIVSANGFAVDTLRQFAGAALLANGVAILLEPGRAA